MIFFALVTILAVCVLFHWILGRAIAAHESYGTSSAQPPIVSVDDTTEDPPKVVDASSYVNRSSCCGALGRRRLNGKEYCRACAHWYE